VERCRKTATSRAQAKPIQLRTNKRRLTQPNWSAFSPISHFAHRELQGDAIGLTISTQEGGPPRRWNSAAIIQIHPLTARIGLNTWIGRPSSTSRLGRFWNRCKGRDGDDPDSIVLFVTGQSQVRGTTVSLRRRNVPLGFWGRKIYAPSKFRSGRTDLADHGSDPAHR